MKQETTLIHAGLKAPRAAAVAGMLFSVLLVSGLVLFRLSVHADPLETGLWLQTNSKTVALGLNLIPFAGIAFFLWFIGVLRDRLGEFEDRFFSTVLLGSGLLFLAMLFASAAVAGGIILAYAAKPEGLLSSPTFTFAVGSYRRSIEERCAKMTKPVGAKFIQRQLDSTKLLAVSCPGHPTKM